MASICIDQGIFYQPIVIYPASSNTQVSITHGGGLAAALAFSERFPLAIDIEKILIKKEFFMSQFTDPEITLIQSLSFANDTAFTVLWTVKEALSKTLKTGLMAPLSIYEVNHMEVKDGVLYSSFANFMQYSAASLIFDTYVCSIVYPKRMPLVVGTLNETLVRFMAISKIPPNKIGGGFFQ
nr:4'-phosphopantetheinyl transferase superfamily protein [Paenibacillus sp. SYP-B3998]